MAFWRRLVCKLYNVVRPHRSEDELDREIASHLTLLQDDLVRNGMSADEAFWAAKRGYGGIEQIKELHRDERSVVWLEQARQDMRYSVRTLRKNPGFTTTVVIALAIGIGANVAIFSVINAVVLKPLPFPDPGRVVVFINTANAGEMASASPAEFNFWRQQTSALQDVSAYRYGRINLTGVDRPEQIQLAEVSPSYFRLFGLSLLRGRAFTDADDRHGGGDVVIVGESFWKRTLASDPQVVGKTINFGGKPYEVIGIMSTSAEPEAPGTYDPSSFRQTIDVWKPSQIDPSSNDLSGYLTVAARLRSGVSLTAANAELELATRMFRRQFSRAAQHLLFKVQRMQDVIDNDVHNQLSILCVAVFFVLLVACSNVASLSVSRATDRTREMSIRAAIGAGRSRLVRQLLTESVILSLAGGAFGILLGLAGIRILLALDSIKIPRVGEHGDGVGVDWRVLLFTVVLSIGTGIFFGLLPALQASSANINELLKESAGRLGMRLWRSSVRSVLVTTEVATAVVLLIGTVHMIRGFITVRFSNPGFDADNIIAMRISLTGARYRSTAGVFGLVENGVSRLQLLPGVVAAASTCCVPLDSIDDHLVGDVIIAGRPLNGSSHGPVNVTTVSPRYFGVLKIPLLRGRSFTFHDISASAPVVVVSRAFVRKFWPQDHGIDDSLKAQLVFPDAPKNHWQVVGVVGDIHADGLSQKPPPIAYFSMAQTPDDLTEYIVRSPIAWLVRTREDSRAMRAAIQMQLGQASGGLPVTNVRSMNEILARSVAGRQFNMLLLIVFGSSALLLAAIGVYGLITYSVHQRTHEIGIRIALGAEPWRVRMMVMLQGLRLLVFGVGIGVGSSWVLTHSIENFLFSFKVQDSFALTITPIVITGIALFATWIPARSASKLDPVQALRHE